MRGSLSALKQLEMTVLHQMLPLQFFLRLLATRANSAATKNAVAITITAINTRPASVLIETPSELPILPH